MIQEFMTQNKMHAYLITVLLPIWICAYDLFLRVTFSKALLDASVCVSCHMQGFDFKNNIIAIKPNLII